MGEMNIIQTLELDLENWCQSVIGDRILQQ